MSEKKGILGFLKGLSGNDKVETCTEEKVSEEVVSKGSKQQERRSKVVEISEEIQQFSVEKCQEILTLAGFNGKVQLRHTKGNVIQLDILDAGDDLGRIIGRNGSCLQAFQTLIKFFIIRKYEMSLRIFVDAEDYKNRFQSQMKRVALKAADKVISTGEKVDLDPMSATDRRAIHVLFENHNDILTVSEGEGDSRHVVLMKRDDSQ